jgi:hypothetical protein
MLVDMMGLLLDNYIGLVSIYINRIAQDIWNLIGHIAGACM